VKYLAEHKEPRLVRPVQGHLKVGPVLVRGEQRFRAALQEGLGEFHSLIVAIRVQARDYVVDSADIDVAVGGLKVNSRGFGLGGDIRRRLAEGERSHEKEYCDCEMWFPRFLFLGGGRKGGAARSRRGPPNFTA
jgi:hypothetical protein